ncbi:MAG: hypothetical protein AUI08_00695 [Gemmatimonadetes bacterium 13_2_20CM_2_65_7]|nr:MAG: hypothetical protein AUI08_00695 [Gemmatimonadetes bacterium 13_2_20CM_2_65_7]
MAAAAIVLLALSWIAYQRFGDRDRYVPSAASFFAGSPFWPTPALSQEIATGDTVGRARYPLLDRVPSRDLRPGSWSYRATMTTDGLVTTEQGHRKFSIAPTTVGGVLALAIVTSGTGRYSPEGFAGCGHQLGGVGLSRALPADTAEQLVARQRVRAVDHVPQPRACTCDRPPRDR